MTSKEQALLRPAHNVLAGLPERAKRDVLEACAARLGGWSLDAYRDQFGLGAVLSAKAADELASSLLDAVRKSTIPPSLALAALAQPMEKGIRRRQAGAYYTDSRLAQHLAEVLLGGRRLTGPVIDPSCGAGMLLGALCLTIGPKARESFVAEQLCGADLDAEALAVARLVVASTLNGHRALDAVLKFDQRLMLGDSLTRSADEWAAVAPEGFAGIIGNPPWEKLKVNHHEGLSAVGLGAHYGAERRRLTGEVRRALEAERTRVTAYRNSITAGRDLQGSGESDLYKLFCELSLSLLAPTGRLAILVPAGVIRSQGTEALRTHLFELADDIGIVVHHNRDRFFDIDTRFKFLTLTATLHDGHKAPIALQHATWDRAEQRIKLTSPVLLARGRLLELRKDLTIPEVRSNAEWELFQRLAKKSTTLEDGPWRHKYVRELDMTNDKRKFIGPRDEGTPVLEGRMVHQFRYRAKAYRSGTGRAAKWQVLPIAEAELKPQFRIPDGALTPLQVERRATVRAGFCDVTGQTNERTLIASVIPPGMLCGNKVPTLTLGYPGLEDEDAAYLWVALANSLVIDWVVRRLTTTSLNYFVLRTIPLPDLTGAEDTTRRLVSLSRELHDMEGSPTAEWAEAAELRAEVDSLVAEAFGISAAELDLILDDFPLLDRGQDRPDDAQSVTRWHLTATHVARTGANGRRTSVALPTRAIAYVPEEYARTISRRK